jgi:tetratricopeptide (TPR) repeat protein
LIGHAPQGIALIEAYASVKSFVPKEPTQNAKDKNDPPNSGFKSRNASVDFTGQKRSNATHQSTTDPEARLFCKSYGDFPRLRHGLHAITENRHGLVLAVEVNSPLDNSEPRTAISLIDRIKKRFKIKPKTTGADKGYDQAEFLRKLERRKIRPHVAVREGRVGGSDPAYRKKHQADIRVRMRMKRRMATIGYQISQRCRKKIEEAIASYEKSLQLDPKYALTLNNLADLLATCPDPKFRDPGQARQRVVVLRHAVPELLPGRFHERLGLLIVVSLGRHNRRVPEQVAKKAKIDTYHLKLFADFLERLRSTPDGDGNLFEHSMFLYGSGMSNGNQHTHDNLPILLAGGGLAARSAFINSLSNRFNGFGSGLGRDFRFGFRLASILEAAANVRRICARYSVQ